MRIFIDMDGTLAKWNNAEAFEMLYEEGYYRNLQPMENVVESVKELITQGVDVYVLSKYLSDSRYALKEKDEWLNEHLPMLSEEKRIFVPYNENKSDYIPDDIQTDDFLLDDYTTNLLEWEQENGIGIKMLNDINHTKGVWKGLFVYHDNNVLSKVIMNIMEYSNTITTSQISEKRNRFNCRYLELKQKLAEKQEEWLELMKDPAFATWDRKIHAKREGISLAMERIATEIKRYKVEIKNSWYSKHSETWYGKYEVRYRENNLLINAGFTSNLDYEKLIESVWEEEKPIMKLNELSDLSKQIVKEIMCENDFGSRIYTVSDLRKMSGNNEQEIKKCFQELDGKVKFDNDVYSLNDVFSIEVYEELLCHFDFSEEWEFVKNECENEMEIEEIERES